MPARDHLNADEFSLRESDVVDSESGITKWGDQGGVDWLRAPNSVGEFRFAPPTELPIDSLEPGYSPVAEYEHAQSIAETDPQEWPPLLVEDYGAGVRKVSDGNHRLEAAKIRGESNIRAYRYRIQ